VPTVVTRAGWGNGYQGFGGWELVLWSVEPLGSEAILDSFHNLGVVDKWGILVLNIRKDYLGLPLELGSSNLPMSAVAKSIKVQV
jgi:hypothetical protein